MQQKSKNGSFLKHRKESFLFALKGLRFLFNTQINAKIELVAVFIVILVGIFLHLSKVEWIIIAAAIFIVLISETINTLVEMICDRISTEYDQKIGVIKDLSSGMVLLSVLLSILTAGIIFIPKLLIFF